MQVRCPACLTAVDVAEEQDLGDLSCPSCGRSFSFAADETVACDYHEQQTIGHFRLERLLGSGTFGEVWLARDTELDRQVAIKIPRFGRFDSRQRELFLREAQAAAQFRHPNVVGVHEVVNEGETVYIVSEYVEGMTLRDWLNEDGEITCEEAAELCAKIAAGLEHLHEAGVVHRDLKPGNIMMEARGEPRILDFGLAKREGDDTTIAVSGHILGTPAYMSPEQARGEAHLADARSDVYALGVILYELLLGRTPYRKDDEALLQRILVEVPKSPRAVDRRVPRDLDTICLKCLEKEPERRYQTAADLLADLRHFLAGEPITARRAGVLERSWRWGRRNPFVVAASGSAAAAGVLLAAVIWQAMRPPLPEGNGGGAITVAKRKVHLETKPSKARVVFVPVNEDTGEPMAEAAVRPEGPTPVDVELLPGTYFVEVEVSKHGFHQVYRKVPPEGEKPLSSASHHSTWTEAGELVTLPNIVIPKAEEITANMALIAGGPFRMGVGDEVALFAHWRDMEDFYLDRTETTYRAARKVSPKMGIDARQATRTADDFPVTNVGFDTALHVAELLGKRLPTEAEYEYAATNRGTTPYPWGDDKAPLEQPDFWPFGRVGVPDHDRTPTTPPLEGLFSGVAEWTDSRRMFYPGAWEAHAPGVPMPLSSLLPASHVVRGGPRSVADGRPAHSDDGWRYGTRWRYFVPNVEQHAGLGFRCCRSRRPTYLE